MKFLKNNFIYYSLFLIILIGGFFRFYNLNWDKGHFFHPDETNNIAIPAANLKPLFRPKEFTYGSLTIYFYRLGALLVSFLTKDNLWLNANRINVVGRFFSTVFSIALIFLIFYLGKMLYSQKVGMLAAIFTSLNVGLIQAAHFGTTETILALAGVLITIGAVFILDIKKYRVGYLLSSITLGLASGAKISALVFSLTFFLAHLFSLTKKNFFKRNFLFLTSCFLTFIVFFLVSPYSILDYSTFTESFKLQKEIATGKLPMFFTSQFKETAPYFFQITKIFPWILGWPILIFGTLGFVFVYWQIIKTKDKKKFLLFFLPSFYFLYNGSLFVKWTRYMIPLTPFFCLFTAIFLISVYQKSKKQNQKLLARLLIVTVIATSFLYAFAFTNIYRYPDTRITASKWIHQNIPSGSNLLLEPLDAISLPLPLKNNNSVAYQQNWFDFYALDDPFDWKEKSNQINNLTTYLTETDYLIIGSRRLYANRLRLKDKYPLTARYYSLLFTGALGFDKIKEVSSYPKIFGVEINDDMAEETFQVFDHPKILIFQNRKHLSEDKLKRLLLYD